MSNVREININSTTYDIIGKGIVDQNNPSTPLKQWSGTKAQYDALVSGGTIDSNTLYNITDDEVITEFANTDLSNITATGQALFDAKANISLDNLDSTGQAVIDGQWVSSSLTLANNVSWTGSGTTYSLSNYLPNDSNKYEVIFSVYASTASTSGKFVGVALKTDIITSNFVSVCQARARTNDSVDCRGNVILPVGTGRSVTQYSTTSNNADGTYTIEACGYRRIGTNS